MTQELKKDAEITIEKLTNVLSSNFHVLFISARGERNLDSLLAQRIVTQEEFEYYSSVLTCTNLLLAQF